MRHTHALFSLLLLAGCKHSESATQESNAHHDTPPTQPAAAPPPNPVSDKKTVPATKVTPTSKPPFESVTFTPTDRKTKAGWPVYDAQNLGDKPVAYMTLWAFAYDKDGKLLKRSSPPLSWNGTIAPGEKSTFQIEIGEFSHDPPVPDTATAFEICYSGIRFDGDDVKKTIDDPKRCGPTKAKGKP